MSVSELPTIKTILCATDMRHSGKDNDAFRMALSLAHSTGAHLVVAHVMETPSASMEHFLENTLSEEALTKFKSTGLKNFKDEIQERLEKFCLEECPAGYEYPNGNPTVAVKEGDPAPAILELADEYEADIIFMGTKIHTKIGQLLLGSTANKVIHSSKKPVMVYPL